MVARSYAAQLNLADCLRMAREHNPLLTATRAELPVAQQQEQLSDSSLYPRVDLQGGYTAQLDPQAMLVNGIAMENQQAHYAFANLAATYTIYDFGRRDARRSQARSATSVVENGIRSKEQDVALQVIEAYFAVLEAEKLIETTQQELTTINEHYRVAQALYDNGVVTKNDLLQADLRTASARQKLLAVRNQADNLKMQLNFLIGGDLDKLPELDESSLFAGDSEPGKGEGEGTLVDAALKRPDIQKLHKQLDISEQEIKESRTMFYPELFARASLDYLQNNKLREQAIYAGTVGLKINLFDGFGSTAAREKAVSQRQQVNQQLNLVRQQALLELSTAQNDLNVARERIEVTRNAIRQGEENLRINQDRYQERVGTATDVLDAQTLLSQARTEYYQAYYAHQVATARLQKAAGLL